MTRTRSQSTSRVAPRQPPVWLRPTSPKRPLPVLDKMPREVVRGQVLALRNAGLSYNKIATQLHLPRSTVISITQRFSGRATTSDSPRPGRPSKLKSFHRNNIVAQILLDESDTAPEVAATMRTLSKVRVSPCTIRRVLHGAGLVNGAKVKKALLKETHKERRLAFALAHQHWTVDDWLRVVFSDETALYLYRNNNGGRVWRLVGETLTDRCVQGTVKFGGGHINVWGAISRFGISLFCEVGDVMNGDTYLSVLESELLASIRVWNNKNEMIFMHDNAPCHKRKDVAKWFETNQITVLDWPANSPDLNPIENAWNMVKNKIYQEREYQEQGRVVGTLPSGLRRSAHARGLPRSHFIDAAPHSSCDRCQWWLYQVLKWSEGAATRCLCAM
ncbi:hypothetical protein CAOG_09225 [Capsaspora owczarzaki ATCC 30864]|uniref:hypothetical protein n=1 Tax=Capsaspora owczarzaki (strain ATCC 30864) TaxID=595528 RepID=UPI0003523B22|nr:hypothetical protein CAOG_09225 [Capsaspora owczarzaki ATCC 30864]|eukprot:XP_011270941.1 hypothetical protein CAOG_09225 [Capsaspora owczarzaki ATCC 30864]